MDEQQIRAALAGLALGERLESVRFADGAALVTLALAGRDAAAEFEPRRRRIEETLLALPGVRSASVVLTAHRPAPPRPAALPLPGIGAVVAVASGKGGVGKSTVAVNLAVALAQDGLKVGLLDADIHGPSLPRMLGVAGQPAIEGGRMVPHAAFGLVCMSIGFLVAAETALVWRGPMVIGALTQMLGQVVWGTLDMLVVDLPPGTGDVPLTLAQKAGLAGVVVVSTPQDIALIDARRAVTMFGQVKVPVLGIAENMSYFVCPGCGARAEIFGHGGARDEAARIGVPFLGEIPLLAEIRATGDAGTPVVAAAPDSAAAAAFRALAARVRAAVR